MTVGEAPDTGEAGIAVATRADLPAVAALMNRAYRGRDAAAGWTTEAGYITGPRTSEALLRDEMASGALPLVWRARDGALLGCVWLAPEGGGAWYLGSLTVEPRAQDAGRGRRLLAAAERVVAARGGRTIRMTVVHLRDSLIAWYARRGYAPTGETRPFPYGDERFGTPTRDDLHFVVLRKRLAPR